MKRVGEAHYARRQKGRLPTNTVFLNAKSIKPQTQLRSHLPLTNFFLEAGGAGGKLSS